MSSARQTVVLGPSLRGCGNRPSFTPCHQVDLETGIGPRGARMWDSLTRPVSGKSVGRLLFVDRRLFKVLTLFIGGEKTQILSLQFLGVEKLVGSCRNGLARSKEPGPVPKAAEVLAGTTAAFFRQFHPCRRNRESLVSPNKACLGEILFGGRIFEHDKKNVSFIFMGKSWT